MTDPPTTTFQNGDATCTSYGNSAIFCAIEGMGHQWPGGAYGSPCEGSKEKCDLWIKHMGPTSYDIIANDAMWDFFQKHSLP